MKLKLFNSNLLILLHFSSSVQKLLTFQCFQIPLAPRMFPIWDFVESIFARKAMLNMGWVLTTLSWQYLYNEKIDK